MRYLLCFAPLLAGCSFLERVADAAGPVLEERGPEVVEKVGEAASGNPAAIAGAAGAVIAALGLIARRYWKKKATK